MWDLGKTWNMALSLCAAVVTLTMGSAHADVLLYQNYTPGTTDYNTSQSRVLGNTLPYSNPSYGVEAGGDIKELSFTFTATTSVIPRHVFLPMLISGYNAANSPAVIIDIVEVAGDGRNWHAAGHPSTIASTLALGDKKVYFSFTEGVTPQTRIGYDYEVTIKTFMTPAQAYLSNVENDSSNYYTAEGWLIEPTIRNVANEPLATEAAVSIHGDFVTPEPGSLALLGLGGLLLARRRRR